MLPVRVTERRGLIIGLIIMLVDIYAERVASYTDLLRSRFLIYLPQTLDKNNGVGVRVLTGELPSCLKIDHKYRRDNKWIINLRRHKNPRWVHRILNNI